MIYYEYTRSNSWYDGTIVRRKLGKGSICYSLITYDSGEWQDSREIFPAVLKLFENEKIGEMKAANRIKPVYLLDVNNLKIAFYLSEIGASLSGTDIIEVNWMTGAKKFILFGSAGSLDKETTKGKYVIPYEAYRDEGMSYHYASPKDYIQIKNAEVMENIFKALELPYVMGKVWTTDAIYREPRNLVEKRKSEGCIALCLTMWCVIIERWCLLWQQKQQM